MIRPPAPCTGSAENEAMRSGPISRMMASLSRATRMPNSSSPMSP